ncbi:hypothetical protein B0H19DRAFT_1077544 [Mycena capillaripes]|nr:hypothetical protein B0H19DRAFT_1077544 [Mycena capillaripes]
MEPETRSGIISWRSSASTSGSTSDHTFRVSTQAFVHHAQKNSVDFPRMRTDPSCHLNNLGDTTSRLYRFGAESCMHAYSAIPPSVRALNVARIFKILWAFWSRSNQIMQECQSKATDAQSASNWPPRKQPSTQCLRCFEPSAQARSLTRPEISQGGISLEHPRAEPLKDRRGVFFLNCSKEMCALRPSISGIDEGGLNTLPKHGRMKIRLTWVSASLIDSPKGSQTYDKIAKATPLGSIFLIRRSDGDNEVYAKPPHILHHSYRASSILMERKGNRTPNVDPTRVLPRSSMHPRPVTVYSSTIPVVGPLRITLPARVRCEVESNEKYPSIKVDRENICRPSRKPVKTQSSSKNRRVKR